MKRLRTSSSYIVNTSADDDLMATLGVGALAALVLTYRKTSYISRTLVGN